TEAGNAVPHRVQVQFFARASEASTWVVIADEKTFILYGYTAGSSLSADQFTVAGAGSTSTQIYVGEDSQGNFIAVGGLNHSTQVPSPYFDGGRGFTVLRDPDTGLLVDTGSIDVHTPGITNPLVDINARPMPVPELSLMKLGWAKNGSPLAGYFRGIACNTMFTRMTVSNVSLSLGGEALTTRTASTPLTLSDGRQYFLSVVTHTLLRFATDN